MKLSLNCIVLVMACSLLAGSAAAQKISLGIKGGLNLSKPWGVDIVEETGDSSLNLARKPGLVVGAVLCSEVNKYLSIQPEVLFSVKGKLIVQESMYSEMIEAVTLYYLEIPILFKLTIPAGGAVPNFYVGPAVAFRTGMDGYAKSGTRRIDLPDEYIRELEKNTHSVDFCLAMGGGVDLVAGPGSFVVDIRYTLGFVKIAKLPEEAEYYGISEEDLSPEKNSVVSIMIGYVFNFGGS